MRKPKIEIKNSLYDEKEESKRVIHFYQDIDHSCLIDFSFDFLNCQKEHNHRLNQLLNDPELNPELLCKFKKRRTNDENNSKLFGKTDSTQYIQKNSVKIDSNDKPNGNALENKENAKNDIKSHVKKTKKREEFEELIKLKKETKALSEGKRYYQTILYSTEETHLKKDYLLQNKMSDPDIY